MKEDIRVLLDKPKQLEKLYRKDKYEFKKAFNSLYPEIQENSCAQIWNERLNYQEESISWGQSNELPFVLMASFLAGLIAKLPDILSLNYEVFYSRNIAFIFLPILTLYFGWRQKQKKGWQVSGAILLSVLYINILPHSRNSDTLLLACIHIALIQWAILGYMYTGNNTGNYHKRIEYLRYNGDLIIITTLILIAGAILTLITIGLFSLIKLDIAELYFKYIVIWGSAASPIVGTFLIQTNPHLVNKVSPVIAKVFTPLVLATLLFYLIAMMGTGKDPFNDREFLLIFNLLLIGVMAIIVFSIAENSQQNHNKTGTFLLLALSLTTILVNGVALAAILFRISEWGITANRLAVLGGNLLILTNLILVTKGLYKMTKDLKEKEQVEKSIARFLPIYTLWAILVTFLFPVLFHFK